MISNSFNKYYSVSKLIQKMQCSVAQGASELFKTAVTLFVILEDPTVPKLVKAIIITSLGYFICPIDIIPDFLPMGLSDDLLVLAATLNQILIYKDVSVEARVDEILPLWMSGT